MARFLKSKKETIGISPDDLTFRGKQKIEHVCLRLYNYNATKIVETELKELDKVADYVNVNSVTWLNIDGLHDSLVLQNISDNLDIDVVALANVLNTHKRSVFHEFDNYLYVSVRMLQFNEESMEVRAENLSLIFKDNLLLSFQEKVGDVFNPVRERLRKGRKLIRSSKADYLAFALLDVVIDNYIHIISLLGEKIEELDDELILNPSAKSFTKINKYKTEINYLRKTIKPCREMILSLCKSDSELIDSKNNIHLNELKNNIEQANESVDSYRDILSDQHSVYHTNMTSRLNDVLKFLTIFSVIFIPITFIVGVYGTNFDNIPELHYRYAYFVMWIVIVLIVSAMIVYFKRKKWF